MRNGWLYLLFRVGNLRTKSNIIETHVTAKMVYPRREKAENQISFDQEELKVMNSVDIWLNWLYLQFVAKIAQKLSSSYFICRYPQVLRMTTEVNNAS